MPQRIGYAGAIDAMGSVASPLFAGFAVVVAIQLLTSPGITRWPNLALGLTLLAAVCLGASVQFSFRARQYAATPPEIEAWWPDPDEFDWQMMAALQDRHQQEFRRWADRSRLAYNVGLLSFLAALTVVLVPLGSYGLARVAVVVLAGLAFVAELVWLVLGSRDRGEAD